jgi:hypothetical protein
MRALLVCAYVLLEMRQDIYQLWLSESIPHLADSTRQMKRLAVGSILAAFHTIPVEISNKEMGFFWEFYYFFH